ncbi:MAG: ABC transporter ATP-binding protein [Anaerolinea sp.]|nr:ABC transporter ATP-binding protein [Anaerolinea sp.]MCC6973879.1 ABC transporter ATP-binding protein [Anaerolineae bacterium]CAG1011869.1 Bacitracin transport ATP-binding protein BcrA [Anaerolineae bacterium]
MAQPVIRLDRLSKRFGKVHALKNVSLEVPAGQVYGFLGPNGAGKTTAIRLILTLLRPTSGEVQLFGKAVRDHHNVLRRVGAIAEGPAFYPFLSGRKNLNVLARTANQYDPARIDHLLGEVGLSGRANQRVKGYSLGMRQRLGLAAALLSDPDLLVLDEPTNGLDPAGMREVRQLIREQATQHGKTVFLSSHLLNEVEQVCDRVAIIHKGEILREGAVADLLADGERLYVEASPLERVQTILQERWKTTPEGDGLVIPAGRDIAPEIVRLLVAQGIDVYQVNVQRQSLEEFFLNVTQPEVKA